MSAAMPGQASQSSNDDDWSMAMAISSVQTPVYENGDVYGRTMISA